MLALRRRDHQAEPPFMRSIVVFVLVKTLLLFVNEVAAAAAAAVATSTYNNTMGLAIFSRTAAPHLPTSKFNHCRVLRFLSRSLTRNKHNASYRSMQKLTSDPVRRRHGRGAPYFAGTGA